jgi:hypothetical protein
MQWWEYVMTVWWLLAGICAFVLLIRYVARFLSKGDDRTADSMYGNYADSPHKQRRYARQHGGQWQDKETGPGSLNGSRPKAPRKAA